MNYRKSLKNYFYKLRFIFQPVTVGFGTSISHTTHLDTKLGGKITIGENCVIHYGTLLLSCGGYITIGNNCSINPYCILYGHGGLTIGNCVRIACHTVIIPSNHKFENSDRHILNQGEISKGIVIEDDVWIGSGSKILDGVTISKGCVIGAGCVVTKTTQPFGVYVGVPAKLIKFRSS